MRETANTFLMNSTRRSIIINHSYSSGGKIASTSKSSIYYAFRLSVPYCIKVSSIHYLLEELAVINQIGNCSTMIPVIDNQF